MPDPTTPHGCIDWMVRIMLKLIFLVIATQLILDWLLAHALILSLVIVATITVPTALKYLRWRRDTRADWE